MKEQDLLDAVGGVDEAYVKNAEVAVKPQKRVGLRWIAAIAACLLVGAGIAIPVLLHRAQKQESAPSEAAASNEAKDGETAEGVFLPAIELRDPSEESGAAISRDMIGLVVYKGRIYTQAGDYFGEDAKPLEALVGKRLGTARGNLNEWSSQDEYATEFASTVPGEVYAVNGYDEGFRICIRGEIRYDEQEDPVIWIQFFDCLNGITLRTGKDLFEDRLRLWERTESVQYQTHHDWDNGLGNVRTVNLDPGVWNTFREQVNSSAFLNLYDPDGNWSDPTNDYATIYDTQNQAHLTLTMRDGTTVELRLIEGGYVGYQPLGWYFVKIPEDVYNAVYDACGGTH